MRDQTDPLTDQVALMGRLIRRLFTFRPLHPFSPFEKTINLLLASKFKPARPRDSKHYCPLCLVCI